MLHGLAPAFHRPQVQPSIKGRSPSIIQRDVWDNCERIYGIDPASLALAMPMWEGAGNVIRDYSGNSNDGTNNGATWTPEGMDFDGVNDFLEKTSASGLPTTIGTIGTWVFPKADSGTMVEISDGSTSDRLVFYFDGFVSGNNLLYFYVTGEGSGANVWRLDSANTTIIENEWQHLLITFDTSTDTYNVYRNRQLITPSSTTIAGNPTGINQVNIGSYYNHTTPFNGAIGEIRILNIVSTASQVALFHDRRYDLYQPVSRPSYFFTTDVSFVQHLTFLGIG